MACQSQPSPGPLPGHCAFPYQRFADSADVSAVGLLLLAAAGRCHLLPSATEQGQV